MGEALITRRGGCEIKEKFVTAHAVGVLGADVLLGAKTAVVQLVGGGHCMDGLRHITGLSIINGEIRWVSYCMRNDSNGFATGEEAVSIGFYPEYGCVEIEDFDYTFCFAVSGGETPAETPAEYYICVFD